MAVIIFSSRNTEIRNTVWKFSRTCHKQYTLYRKYNNSHHKGKAASQMSCLYSWNHCTQKTMSSHWNINQIPVLVMLKAWCGGHHVYNNSTSPRQNGRHFTDDIFKHIFVNENVWILLKISLKFISKVPINNISALIQIMACRWLAPSHYLNRLCFILLMHICVTGPL